MRCGAVRCGAVRCGALAHLSALKVRYPHVLPKAQPETRAESARVRDERRRKEHIAHDSYLHGAELIDLLTLILKLNLTVTLTATGEESGYSAELLMFLLKTPRKLDAESPVEWINDSQWGMVELLSEVCCLPRLSPLTSHLSSLTSSQLTSPYPHHASHQYEGFTTLAKDLEESAPRFLEWFNHTTPESEKLPLDWRTLDSTPFRKLVVIRCLRPDRLTVAVNNFIRATLPSGGQYTDADGEFNSYQVLEQAFLDSDPTIPIYFILSPGANVVADVDKLAVKMGQVAGSTYHNISLGQGQDVVAQEKLENGHRQGHWVILNNVHLMPRWLKKVRCLTFDI